MGIYRSTNPAEFDDVDGIIVNESAPAPNIKGVSTGIAILVGQFQRGPAALTEVGSIGEFHEIYGKSDYPGNKELKNKKFSRLVLGRVIASDAVQASKAFQSSAANRITFAAKQGKGVYGNNIQVKIEEASSARQEKHTITAVADVSSSLDGKYFVLPDENGTVGFWIDVADGGGSAPAGALAADRQVEITTIAENDADTAVATKIAAAIEADSKFSAVASGAVVTATCLAFAPGDGSAAAGDSGFTVAKTQAGVYAGKKYTFRDTNAGSVIPQQSFDDVKIAQITSETFASARLVVATVNSAAAEPDNCDFTSLASGSDGTVADSDYEAEIALCEIENAGNVLFLDSYNANRRNYLKLHALNAPDKTVILAAGENDDKAVVLADVANNRDVEGRIIYAFPWLETVIGGVKVFTSPASWYASIISNTHPKIDPAFAENTQFLAGVTGMKYQLSRADYIQLAAAGVSAFEYDRDIGFKVKSGVVTQIANSSKIMVFRRRMADYLTQSAGKFLKNYQNAVNTAEGRREAKGAISRFVQAEEQLGNLPKDKEVQNGKAKIIDVDSVNTNDSIAAGFFCILWKQRIYSSNRFIVLQAEIGESVVVTEAEG
jgi:hypothetical protein